MPIGILGGVIGGIGSIIGSSNSANAATNAARLQAQAANNAAALQGQEYNSIAQNLLPWQNTGVTAQAILARGFGVSPTDGTFNPNAPYLQPITDQLGPPPNLAGTTLAQVPGYQMPDFNYQASPGYAAALAGGTEALTNAGAGKTGALSGNTLKALQGYGTGLANQDYQQNYQNFATNYNNQYQYGYLNNLNQYNANAANNASQYNAASNNYWNVYNALNQNRTSITNALTGLSGSGENAAAALGGFGTSAAGSAGNALIGGGNALAAGQVGAANATAGGINSALTALNSPTNNSTSLLGSLFSNIFGGNSLPQADYYAPLTGILGGNSTYGGGGDYATGL